MSIRNKIDRLYDSLPADRGENDCWLHPRPPANRSDGRQSGLLKLGDLQRHTT